MRARRGDRTTEECKQRKSQIRGSALSRSRLKQLNNNNSGYEGPPERNVFYYVNGRCAVRHSRNCSRVSSSEKRVKNHLRLCCNNDIPREHWSSVYFAFFFITTTTASWLDESHCCLSQIEASETKILISCLVLYPAYLQIAELSDNSATNR